MTESNLPSPLVPPEVDLRDFRFLPLDVVRLRDSDLAATESPEACWAAVLLWCASWHQLPAASLPDDDRVLSNLAGYGRVVKEWQRVRSGTLRGWVLCSDARLYHPVVAEKAVEAWRGKLEQRWRTELARVKKYNQRHKTNVIAPEFDEWLSLGRPQGQTPVVSEDNHQMSPETNATCPPGQLVLVPGETPSKGQGEGQGQGHINTPLTPSSRKKPAIALDTFLAQCRESKEPAVTGYQPLWDYATSVSLPRPFVELAWDEFKRQFRAGGTGQAKRQKDWRGTFRNYVEKGYLKLWVLGPDGQFKLTTQGQLAERLAAPTAVT